MGAVGSRVRAFSCVCPEGEVKRKCAYLARVPDELCCRTAARISLSTLRIYQQEQGSGSMMKDTRVSVPYCQICVIYTQKLKSEQ